MTGNKCLLDTNIIIDSFKKKNDVGEKLDSIEEIYVSVIVVGELHYGIHKSADPLRHLAQVKSFLTNCKILSADIDTAEVYGHVKAALIKKGKPIPENDIWIGAFAQQHNLPLDTKDKHFSEIITITLFD